MVLFTDGVHRKYFINSITKFRPHVDSSTYTPFNPLTPRRTQVSPFTGNFNYILRRDHQKNFL